MEEEGIRLAAPAVNDLRVELGLAPDPAGDRLRAAPYLTVMPEALEDPAAPSRADPPLPARPAAEPDPLPDWWPGNRDPLVYLTFGRSPPVSTCRSSRRSTAARSTRWRRCRSGCS